MPIERCRHGCELRVTRIKPGRPLEAVPRTLSHNMSTRMTQSEILWDDAEVAGKDRSDSEFSKACDDSLRRLHAPSKELPRNRFVKAAQITHELPVLVRRLCDPIPDLAIRIAEIAEGPVENFIGASL